MKLYMFRTVPLSIIRSFPVYTQQWYMSYRFADSCEQDQDVPSWSCSQGVWHIPLLCLQWKTPDGGQRNCPKHVEFHFRNKFEKLVHLVGFVIRNLSRCTVTWTANSNVKVTNLQYKIPFWTPFKSVPTSSPVIRVFVSVLSPYSYRPFKWRLSNKFSH